MLERLRAKARSLGLWCVQSPAEYGGAGLDLLGQCVVAEEAAKCRMGLYFPACGAFGQDPPLVIFNGTRHQIEKYGVAAIAKGQKTFVAISEASGGSDPGARDLDARRAEGRPLRRQRLEDVDLRRRAAPTGACSTRAPARRATAAASRRSSSTRSAPGIHWKKIRLMRSYQPFEVTFENYEIPVEDRLGEEGGGFRIAENWLVHARVPYAAASIGVAQESLRAGDRMGQAARDLRPPACRQAGDPVDDRRLRDRAARGAPARLPGGLEGRPRRGHQDRRLDRQGRTRPRPRAAWSIAACRFSAASA